MSLYGGAVAASALLAACLMAALTPKDRRYTVPLTAALSIALGLIGARLVFWLCSWTLYMDQLRDFSTLFRVRDGGHTQEYWHQALRMALPFASRNFEK